MVEEEYTDFSIKLSAFFLKFIGAWIVENEKVQLRRKFSWWYAVGASNAGIVLFSRDLYYNRHDFSAFLFACCNLIILITVVIKLFVIMRYKKEFINLIVFMRDHFWKNSYDYQEKDILTTARKTCIMFTSIVTLTGHGAIVGYLITPVIDNIGQNKSERALPFNFWLDLPLTITPYYEIAFVLQIVLMYPCSICFFSFDNMLCIINVHASGQFRILQYRLSNLCQTDENGNMSLTNYMDKSYEKMKACVQQHQMLIDYCLKIENVYTVTILAQVLIFSVLICLFGYQVLMMDSSIAKRSIFVFLIIGSMVLLFMCTYSCHILMEQSENIGTAAYSALWTLMPMQGNGKMLRHGLMMIIIRSQKVCCLTANGFFPISLETYSTVISTAVSYFMLLSQSVETIES